MHTKQWFSAVLLAALAGFFVAACGSAEPPSSAPAVLALTEATSAPEPTAPVASPPAAQNDPPMPLPTSTPQAEASQAAATEPARFPTPEPWQPAPEQPAASDAAASDPAADDLAPETGIDPAATETSAGESTPLGSTAPYELGVCFSELADQGGPPTAISCDQPHRVEVYHVGAFDDPAESPHPGEALLERGLEQCSPSFEALPGVAQSGESFEALVHAPSPRQWDNGARFLACVLVFPEAVDQPLAQIDRSVAPATLGACFSGTDVNSLSPVDCQEPHRFQVYAITGVLEIDAAEDFCRRALGDEALFVDFNSVWQADVIVGDDQVDCYLSSPEPTTGSVFDDPEG